MRQASHLWNAATRAPRRTGRASRARRLTIEMLEPRQCLAGGFELTPPSASWQNPLNPLDADGDGLVLPIDVLIRINSLNIHGSGPLPARTGSGGGVSPWLDTDNDGRQTPQDVLRTINALNGDQAGPSIELLFVDGEALPQYGALNGNAHAVFLRGEIRDELTGVSTLHLQIGNEAPTPVPFSRDGDFVYVPPAGQEYPAGVSVVHLTAEDARGNQTGHTFSISIGHRSGEPSSEPTPTYAPEDEGAPAPPMVKYAGDLRDAKPLVVVGDPNGKPEVTPDSRVDPNVATSPFAGVVSIKATVDEDSFYTCTGSLFAADAVLTAAHCVDVTGGTQPDGNATGDGKADFDPADITVIFNHANASNDAQGAVTVKVAEIILHPDWHGFMNKDGPEGAVVNDDLAILRLAEKAPDGVPIYPLVTEAPVTAKRIVIAGYGTTGNAIDGFQEDSGSLYVKRTGQNVASQFDGNDENPFTAREIFLFDFDGPDETTDTLDDGLTLGNDTEVTTGEGDSGGPSFLWDDANQNGDPESKELRLYGVNTFSADGDSSPEPPDFGSLGGGMLLGGAYADFVFSQVPSAAPTPVIAPQKAESTDLQLHWSAGGPINEFWFFTSQDSWNLEQDRVQKLTVYGNPRNVTVRGLPSGTIWVTGCTGWVEDGRWVTSKWSERVPYTVLDGPRSPIIAPQDVVSSDLQLRWSAGGPITEFWFFTSQDSWNLEQDRVQKLTVYGNPQNVTVRGLPSGKIWVTGCTGWEENGQWVTTPWSERVEYTVLDGPRSPVIAPQDVVSSDLQLRWSAGGPITEFWFFTSQDSWNLGKDRVYKLTVYGNPQSYTIRDLPSGKIWVTGCTGWEENGQWVTTPWSERVEYVVA